MIGIRHEKYESLIDKFPFFIHIDLDRNPYTCSKEQNWHDNIEIQMCTGGSGMVLLNGEKHEITENDIIAVGSNVIHYTATENHLTYSCIIISCDWCKHMAIDYDSISFSPLIKDEKLQNLFRELIHIYSTPETSMQIAKANETLLKMMIYITENYSVPKLSVSSDNQHFEKVKATVTYIQKNYNRKITLDEIAKAVLYDKYALCKIFKKLTGQTITENLNHYRSLKAIEYLSNGHNITETAFMCGFNNLSFFTKTFKKHIGQNPSFYKK